MKKINPWISVIVFCASVVATALADDSPVFDVPRLHNIRIDGDPADWGDLVQRIRARERLATVQHRRLRCALIRSTIWSLL